MESKLNMSNNKNIPREEYLNIRITKKLHAHLEASNQIVEFKDAENPVPYWNISPTVRRQLLHIDTGTTYYENVSEKKVF